MPDVGEPRAWLLLAAGDERQFGGNSGYDDQPDLYYTWDSTVANHSTIGVGDIIAIWDKRALLGVSVVESIDQSLKPKIRLRCPGCGRTNIQVRSSKSPIYKCQRCRHEFDVPRQEAILVTEYRSRHDAAWTWTEGAIDVADLRELCWSPKSQHSMRSLRLEAFTAALADRGGDTALERAFARAADAQADGRSGGGLSFAKGHTRAFVRVRRGQSSFRKNLLAQFGGACAFTGDAPERVLEAGHLYSYAELGEHHEHGGLLLRRDIHRLFDDGLLAVDPGTRKVNVSETLEPYEQYARLHDTQLRVPLNTSHLSWLERHWNEHRSRAESPNRIGG